MGAAADVRWLLYVNEPRRGRTGQAFLDPQRGWMPLWQHLRLPGETGVECQLRAYWDRGYEDAHQRAMMWLSDQGWAFDEGTSMTHWTLRVR